MEFNFIILSLCLVSISQGTSITVRPHGPRPLDPEIIQWLEEKANDHETDINDDLEETLELFEETTKEDYDMDNEIYPVTVRPHGPMPLDPEIIQWLKEKANDHEDDITNDIEETLEALGSSITVRPHGPMPLDPEIIQWLKEKANDHEAHINNDIEETLEVSEETTKEDYDMDNDIYPHTMKITSGSSVTVRPHGPRPLSPEIIQWLEDKANKAKSHESDITNDIEEKLEVSDETAKEDFKINPRSMKTSVTIERALENLFEEGILQFYNSTLLQTTKEDADFANDVDTQAVANLSVIQTSQGHDNIDRSDDEVIWSDEDATEDTLTVLDAASLDRSEADIKRLSKTVGTLVLLSFSLGYFV